MKGLYIRAFAGLMFLLLVMAAAVFLSAWTFDYWQAWVFLAVFDISVALITVYVAKHDPKLLERRVSAGPTAEKETNQKIIQAIAQFTFLSMLIIPALDHRFGWSQVPFLATIAGDVLVVLGLYVVFKVFEESTFASATVEVQSEQKVISTGPYAIVRHPMYSGAIVMILGVPIALGSWWGLLVLVPFTAVIVARGICRVQKQGDVPFNSIYMVTLFWPEFGVLFAASLVGGAAVLPYGLRLLWEAYTAELSGVEAALAAGLHTDRKTCREIACKMRKRPHVQEAITRLLAERVGASKARVIDEISSIAFQVFGSSREVASNAVEVYVHRLRRHLAECGAAVEIHTVRGAGYLLAGKR